MFKKTVLVVLTLLWSANSVVLSQPADDQSEFVSDHAYTIAGKVWSEYDYKQGSVEEVRVPGVTVSFYRLGDPDPVATTITDDRGEFEIKDLRVAEPYALITAYRAGFDIEPLVQGIGPLTHSSGYLQTSFYYQFMGRPSPQYLVRILTVTTDGLLIDGVTVTFTGPSIGTKTATTTNSGKGSLMNYGGVSSLLTLTPTVQYSGKYGTDLSGPVTITASKPGWTFIPSSISIEGSRTVMFVGTPTEESPANEWTGTWDTTWGGGVGNTATLNLRQSGTSVTGNYNWNSGSLIGTILGNTLNGTWSQTSLTGTFEFVMSEEGNSFAGSWTDDSNPLARGTWDGVRGSDQPSIN